MIQLYADCAMYDFHHLPVAGGLWDQDPRVISSFRAIRSEMQKVEEAEDKKNKKNSRPRGGRLRG